MIAKNSRTGWMDLNCFCKTTPPPSSTHHKGHRRGLMNTGDGGHRNTARRGRNGGIESTGTQAMKTKEPITKDTARRRDVGHRITGAAAGR